MNGYYYFAFTNGDPMRTSFRESEISIEELRKQFAGTWVSVGDEEHDTALICDIWTETQARAYYND